jgi:membrane peptidoglycan carboxypeptidase
MKRELSFITKVEDLNGNILYEKKYIDNQVLNSSYTYILNELLTSTYNSAFKDYNTPTIISLASKISRKYAMKTGSTQSDCWMIGYNPNILMMVWNGYDDNREVKAGDGNIAKNIWVNTIESYDIDNKEWYDTPDNVVGLLLDSITGEKVIDKNRGYVYYFIKGSEDILE